MKKLVFVFFICFCTIQTKAQNQAQAVDFSRFGDPITNTSYINRDIVNKIIHDIEKVQRSKSQEELMDYILSTIEGTPYLNNDFLDGNITASDGTLIKGAKLRFNVFNDRMEVKQNNMLFELSNDVVRRVQIGGRTFDYLKYELDQKESVGYLEMISEGKWKLYCRYSKKYKEVQPQKAMEEHDSPAEFRDLPPLFFLLKEGAESAQGFRSKKELLQLFPENRNEMQAYMKKNKMKHNEPEDLQKLLGYYFSL